MKNKITILTPTYNREYILSKAYNSLLNQTNNHFSWLIIDDGSTDNTFELVQKMIKENKIKIKYLKKENGGKHTALNYGISKINSDYLLILDSDDELSDNAIELMYKYIDKYDNDNKIAAISFLKGYDKDNAVEKKVFKNETISNNIDFRYNQGYLKDMAELYKTKILKKYPFPEYFEEKFISECIVWNKIALDYKTVYVNDIIYFCNYLNDGLSKNWLKQVINSPNGARDNALFFMNKKFKLLIRLKNCIEYGVFSFIAKKKIIKESKMKIISFISYPFCFVIAYILKNKYKIKNM